MGTVRILNVAGRLSVECDDGSALDVASASGGVFGPDMHSAYDRWDEFSAWLAGGVRAYVGAPVDTRSLGSPVPRPRQVFAVGRNYRAHAAETDSALPDAPIVFTKFPSAVTGPFGVIDLPRGSVDFEVELVVVMGRVAARVSAADAWAHVAGLTLGQDLSERELQLSGPTPQFNLGKSFAGFAPIGPAVVTAESFADPNAVEISCSLNGVQVQRASTADMIFSVPAVVEYLSSVVTLLPGDLIFTGTPEGIGWARDPKLLIRDGDVLSSSAIGIGEMRHSFRGAQECGSSI